MVGPACSWWKDGKQSKLAILPPKLADDIERAASDPKLVRLKEEIIAVDAMIAQLYRRLDDGHPADACLRAHKLIEASVQASGSGDHDRAAVLMNEQRRVLKAGVENRQTYDDVGKLIDRKQRLVDSEWKRALQAGVYVNVARMSAAWMVVANAVARLPRQEDRRMLSNLMLSLKGREVMDGD